MWVPQLSEGFSAGFRGLGPCGGAQGFGVKSGMGWEWGGVLRILTVHPDSPQAASAGFLGTGSRKSHCFPLRDMGFGPVWQSPTLSPQRTTVGSRGERIRGSLLHKDTTNTRVHKYTHIYVHTCP